MFRPEVGLAPAEATKHCLVCWPSLSEIKSLGINSKFRLVHSSPIPSLLIWHGQLLVKSSDQYQSVWHCTRHYKSLLHKCRSISQILIQADRTVNSSYRYSASMWTSLVSWQVHHLGRSGCWPRLWGRTWGVSLARTWHNCYRGCLTKAGRWRHVERRGRSNKSYWLLMQLITVFFMSLMKKAVMSCMMRWSFNIFMNMKKPYQFSIITHYEMQQYVHVLNKAKI